MANQKNPTHGLLGDELLVTLTAGVGSAACTAQPKWARVASYPHARVTIDNSANTVNVDLSAMGANAPSKVLVFVQTNEKWSPGPGSNWG